MSRTHRRNDDEYYGRSHSARKDTNRGSVIPRRDIKNATDDSFLEDDDEDFELNHEELASIEDTDGDDLGEEDD